MVRFFVKATIILFLFTCFFVSCSGLKRKYYRKTCFRHYQIEVLKLKRNNKFKYKRKNFKGIYYAKGTWEVCSDTIVLNDNKCYMKNTLFSKSDKINELCTDTYLLHKDSISYLGAKEVRFYKKSILKKKKCPSF
jgi:hypothetical protein